MVSFVPNDPRSPMMSGAGLAVLGAPLGQTAGGRLSDLDLKVAGLSARHALTVERGHPLGRVGHILQYINAQFSTRGGTGFYRAYRNASNEGLYVDYACLPEADYWRYLKTTINGISPTGLKLDWRGDPETTRFTVRHATQGDFKDAKTVQIGERLSFVTIENMTGNEATLELLGSDGNRVREGSYTVTVDYDGTIINVTVEDDLLATSFTVESENQWIRFGRALQLRLPDPWPVIGETVFSVRSEIPKTYRMRVPKSGSNYLQVTAQRNDNAPLVPSAWVSKSLVIPPNPVTDVGFAFVSEGVIRVTFTMPTDIDIEGAWVFHSWPEVEGYCIPYFVPAEVLAAPDEEVTFDVTGLIPGKYTFLIRAFNTKRLDDQSDHLYTVFLSATGLSFAALAAPTSFRAIPRGLGSIEFVIRTNAVEDEVALYWDNGTGTIDYDTPFAVFDTSYRVAGVYNVTLNNLPGGSYRFHARNRLSGVEEKNATALDEVTIYDENLLVPYGLQVTEVL